MDAEILHQLIVHVKGDSRFSKAKSFVGLGHSYGRYILSRSITSLSLTISHALLSAHSSLLTGIASLYPTLLDKIILTGFTLSGSSTPEFALALSPFIAALQNPTKFGRYKNDSRYLITESAPHDLSAFFDGTSYVPGVFDAFTAGKGAFSLGQLITLGSLLTSWPARNFTGSVLVVAGDHDLAFCGGNCWQKPSLTNGTSLLSDVKTIFPAATKFATFIPVSGFTLRLFLTL